MHLIRKKVNVHCKKGKHHVSVSHMGKLKGRSEKHRKVEKGAMSPGE